MRSVVISILIAAAIVAGSIAYTNHLENLSEEFLQINKKITEYVDAEDYFNADSEIERLSVYLDKKRVVLDATGNHDEIDEIKMNLSELAEYSKGQKKTDALSKCHTLDILFEHLPMDYELKLENIL